MSEEPTKPPSRGGPIVPGTNLFGRDETTHAAWFARHQGEIEHRAHLLRRKGAPAKLLNDVADLIAAIDILTAERNDYREKWLNG